VRDGDTVARLGGDEFAVLLPDVPAGDRDAVVARIADCLCRQLAAELDPPVRASIGAAVGSAATHTPDQLLDDADLAMYAAKARGKGTLVLFDGAQPRWLRSA
jgi:diguanylate cyclase (GGDEF)-like protein